MVKNRQIQKKTSHLQVHRRAFLMLCMVFITAILSINLVFAFEWDNVKSYDESKRQITIDNALGLGDNLAEITLESSPVYHATVGNDQLVAEFTINNLQDYNEGIFDDMEFFDLKNGMKELDRKFTYKLKQVTYETQVTQERSCENEDKLFNCVYTPREWKKEKISWIPLDDKILFTEKGNLTVGVFTTVWPNERVEWIPTLYGVRINEWAVWDSGLTAGLKRYWTMNQTSGTMAKEIINGADLNVTNSWTEGHINGSFSFPNANEYDQNATIWGQINDSEGSMTINMWLNKTGLWAIVGVDDRDLISGSGGSGSGDHWNLQAIDSNIAMRFQINGAVTSGNFAIPTTGSSPFEAEWFMVTIVMNSTTMSAYVNGSYAGVQFDRSGYDWGGDNTWEFMARGGAIPMRNGQIDEFSVWNRTLSDAEIVQLYNNGDGLTFVYSDNNTPYFVDIDNVSRYTNESVLYNINASDDVAVDCFTVNDTTNFAINCSGSLSNITALSVQQYFLNITINDTSNNLNSTEMWVNVSDATGGIPYFTDFNNISEYNNISIGYDINATSTGGISCFTVNDTTNFAINCSGFLENATGLSVQQYYLNITINSSDNQLHSDEMWVNISSWDLYPPYFVDIANITGYKNQSIGYDINASDNDALSCFTVNDTTNFAINCSGFLENATALSSQQYFLNITINDTVNRLNSTEMWVNITEINITDEDYSNVTFEGNIESFFINVTTYGNDLTSASLIYNGTSYSGTIDDQGSVFEVNRTIYVPSTNDTQNFTFYWELNLEDGAIYNSTSHSQTISPILINETCSNAEVIYNLTLVDEKSQEELNETLQDTLIEVDYYIYTEDRSSVVTQFYKQFNETNPVAICIHSNLTTQTYSTDLQIQYGALNYSTELYHIERAILNSTNIHNNVTLFDLDDDNAQEFRLIARDSSFLPIDGALIEIQRKYIENGTFFVTEVPKTDDQGITSADLELDDVIYNFLIYYNGSLISSFTNVLAICQTPLVTTCEIDFNAVQTKIDLPEFEIGEDFNFTLSYNDTSKVIKSIFLIPSGEPSLVELKVIREDVLGTAVCSDSVTSSSGTLSCTIPNSFGNSTVLAKISKDGVEQGRGNIKLDQKSSDIFGVVLVMLSVLVLMTLIGIGVSDSPVVTGTFLFVGALLLFGINLVQNNGFIGATATILFFAVAIVLILIKAARRS